MFRRLLKWLAYIAAAGVMLLAILVGLARLLLPMVPEYQGEIRRWARAATGSYGRSVPAPRCNERAIIARRFSV